MNDYEIVIGLEVHLQLKTKSKIFCGCRNMFGAEPNTNVCPVCLGLPGSLPVLNRQVLLDGIRVGLALNCEINTLVKFDRKNYFYPDLPKGYQISQYDFPIAKRGHLTIETGGMEKRIGITRAHLEEDAGKLIHDDKNNCSLVDYNRTGTPLVEIVSEPDLRSAQEAYDYLTALKLTLQYLNVSDCDMEKGSLRCDANVSVRPVGQAKFGTKTELKNMNSFSAVKRAIDFEASRQMGVLSSGGTIVQETLLWDEAKGMTSTMRSKEEAHDYRYFPEPDLVPFTLEAQEIERAKAQLPELPYEKLRRFMSDYKLSAYDATIVVQDPALADFYEKSVKLYAEPKKICNWMIGPVLKEINQRKISFERMPLAADEFVQLVRKVDEGQLSNLAGKDVLTEMIDSGKPLEQIIKDKGLMQVNDDGALEAAVDQVLADNPKAVAEIKSGKTSAMGFLVGQAMKKMQGKANPKKISEILNRRFQNA